MPKKEFGPLQRALLLATGGIALALGVLGGLWRLGWELPLPGTEPASFHGALTVAAFFGTLFGLEHAAADGRRRAYLGPGCAAAGGLATALGAPHPLAASLLLIGSATLFVLAFRNWRQEPLPQTAMAMAGALCGVAGNAFWLAGLASSEASGAWAAFLVLSVVGERLELSHLKRPGNAVLAILGAATLLLIGGGMLLPWYWRAGAATMGGALVLLSLWLLIHDVASRNLRHRRQDRFTALCVVSGHAWLGIGGLILPFAANEGALYDAALHAVFVGFVFAAVIAHTSAILPSLLDVEVPYSPLFYSYLLLLEASLAARVAGDVFRLSGWTTWGGIGNALALGVYVIVTAATIVRTPPREH